MKLIVEMVSKLELKTATMATSTTSMAALPSAKLSLAGSATRAQVAEMTSEKKSEVTAKTWEINNVMIRTIILVMAVTISVLLKTEWLEQEEMKHIMTSVLRIEEMEGI